jgi:hypothetical protein
MAPSGSDEVFLYCQLCQLYNILPFLAIVKRSKRFAASIG